MGFENFVMLFQINKPAKLLRRINRQKSLLPVRIYLNILVLTVENRSHVFAVDEFERVVVRVVKLCIEGFPIFSVFAWLAINIRFHEKTPGYGFSLISTESMSGS